MPQKLILKAKGYRALGTSEDTFTSCVLFHQAAKQLCPQLYVTSPSIWESPDRVEEANLQKLKTLVERCYCYVEGLDPIRAKEIWSEMATQMYLVPSHTQKFLLEKLGPKYTSQQREFKEDQKRFYWNGYDPDLLFKLTEKYPGCPDLWWIQYQFYVHLFDKRSWTALEKCKLLLE